MNALPTFGRSLGLNLTQLSKRRVSAVFIWLLFVFITFVLFHNGFNSPMLYDTEAWIQGKSHVFLSEGLSAVIALSPNRPLYQLVLYVIGWIFGIDTYFFRLFNIFVLASAGTALAWLGACLQSAAEDKQLRHSGRISFVSFVPGLLFVLHPLQIFSALYIWQGAVLLACLCYFCAMATYVQARLHSQRSGYYAAGILFTAGMLSKEIVLTLPLVLMTIEFVLFRQGLFRLLRRVPLVVVLCLPGLAVYCISMRLWGGGDSIVPGGIVQRLQQYYYVSGLTASELLITHLRIMFEYMASIILPWVTGTHLIKSYTISTSLFDPLTGFFALIGFVILVGTGLIAVRKNPLVSLGIFFFIVTLLPDSLLMPKYLFFGYRAILPMAGMAFILLGILPWIGAQLAIRFTKSRCDAIAIGVLISTSLIFGTQTYVQSKTWHPAVVWEKAFSCLPPLSTNVDVASYMDVLVNYTGYLNQTGDFSKTVDLLRGIISALDGQHESSYPRSGERSATEVPWLSVRLRRSGHLDKIYINMGFALAHSGRINEAIEKYQGIIAIEPKCAHAHNNLGNALEQRGDFDAAMAHFKKAVELEPHHPQWTINLVNSFLRKGLLDQAMKLYRSASPDLASPESRTNLGFAFLTAGRPQEAEWIFRRAIEGEGKFNAELHNALGVALAQQSRLVEARFLFAKALELDPRHSDARTNLETLEIDKSNQRSVPSSVEYPK